VGLASPKSSCLIRLSATFSKGEGKRQVLFGEDLSYMGLGTLSLGEGRVRRECSLWEDNHAKATVYSF